MSRSHAMIILYGVCGQSRQCLASSSVKQSGHCVKCRPAAIIMPIMTSVGWVGCSVYGGNQRARLGGESWPCCTAAGCGSSLQKEDGGSDSVSFRAVICLFYFELCEQLCFYLYWTDHPAWTPIYHLSLTLWHFTESQSDMKWLDLSNNGRHVIYNLLVYINLLFRLCTIYMYTF